MAHEIPNYQAGVKLFITPGILDLTEPGHGWSEISTRTTPVEYPSRIDTDEKRAGYATTKDESSDVTGAGHQPAPDIEVTETGAIHQVVLRTRSFEGVR